ncbi:flagellar biosynthetic protein FliR [uncultured Jatrophihabitans sp.]|uniref:flagellar biosynthetic protein FliR n=1 Tax=uncultured Jatrophihabitans sp. TaxID=1610747 RepID=UPI0035CC2AAD
MNLTVAPDALVALLLASTRILAWSMIAPPLATVGLPATVKTVVSVALGLAVVPLVKSQAPPLDAAAVAGAVVLQVAVGAGLGFVTRLLFAAVESAGALIDVFGGFSLSAAYNPLTTTMTSVFGSFYAMLCTTLIFVSDVHLVVFEGFLRTFTAVPLDAGVSLDRLGKAVTSGMTQMFVAALQIAGPLIVVLFVADVALGVLNRIAPQLNAFSLSFPLKIGLTLLLVGSALMLMPDTIAHLAEETTSMVSGVMGT